MHRLPQLMVELEPLQSSAQPLVADLIDELAEVPRRIRHDEQQLKLLAEGEADLHSVNGDTGHWLSECRITGVGGGRRYS